MFGTCHSEKRKKKQRFLGENLSIPKLLKFYGFSLIFLKFCTMGLFSIQHFFKVFYLFFQTFAS
jgi:hypothetical protein